MRRAHAGLIVVLFLDVWLRAHTFGPWVRDRLGVDLWPSCVGETEPLDCDESAYAYMGRRVLRGDVLYRDLTENKPPLGYWLYALSVATGGARELTIRIMPIPFVLATIAMVWWVALRLRGEVAAVVGAAVFAMASTDPYLFGNGANMEHFLNAFVAAALALMVAAWRRRGRGLIFAAGVCLGAACLVKQVAVAHWPVFAIALMWRRHELENGGVRPLTARLRDVLALTGGMALVCLIAGVVLVAQGAGPKAFDDIVRYGGALATDTPADPYAPPIWMRWLTGNADPRNGSLPWPFGRTDYLVWWGTGTWPLWLAALPAIGWLAIGVRLSSAGEPSGGSAFWNWESAGPRRLVAAWTLSTFLQVILPGLYWPHYYLLPLPGLAITLAVALADAFAAARIDRRRAALWIVWGILTFTSILWSAWNLYRDYLKVSPEELTVRYKGGRQWVTLRALGRELAWRSRVWPSPHLYVWGWQSPLFIYSGLDGVSRHFFADPLLKAYAAKNHPITNPRTARIMRDLRAHPPELIFAGDPPFPALREFIRERYLPSRLVPTTPDGRGLWVEREGYGRFETAIADEKRLSSP